MQAFELGLRGHFAGAQLAGFFVGLPGVGQGTVGNSDQHHAGHVAANLPGQALAHEACAHHAHPNRAAGGLAGFQRVVNYYHLKEVTCLYRGIRLVWPGWAGYRK